MPNMITETITYVDFDGEEHTDTLNFHISEAILLENIDVVDRLQEMLKLSQQPQRTLTTQENQDMLDLVKRFMMLSYGVRTTDGGFDQDDPVGKGPVWKKFKISSAYNAFLLSLFQPVPARSAVFMYRVLPTSIRGEVGDLDIDKLDPELRDTVKTELAKDKRSDRLPRGTRIVEDVPQLAAVPDQSSTDEVDPDMDYDALMDKPAKRPISQSMYDTMKAKLKPAQFDHFMSTRYVSEEA